MLVDYRTFRQIVFEWIIQHGEKLIMCGRLSSISIYCLLTILTSSIAEKLLTKRLTLTMVPASARKKEEKE